MAAVLWRCGKCKVIVSSVLVNRLLQQFLNPGPVTMAIMAANTLLFAMALALSTRTLDFYLEPDLEANILLGAKWPYGLLSGQYWRLLTAGFLHAGIIHFAVNSLTLLDMGSWMEDLFGRWRFTAIYIFSTMAGFWLSAWKSPSTSVGASAALFGLIGAVVAAGLRDRGHFGQWVRTIFIKYMFMSMGLNIVLAWNWMDRMDNWAHLGGFLGGALSALVLGVAPREAHPEAKAESPFTLARVISIAVYPLLLWAYWEAFVFFRAFRL
jgi:rhomboid protease GluP